MWRKGIPIRSPSSLVSTGWIFHRERHFWSCVVAYMPQVVPWGWTRTIPDVVFCIDVRGFQWWEPFSLLRAHDEEARHWNCKPSPGTCAQVTRTVYLEVSRLSDTPGHYIANSITAPFSRKLEVSDRSPGASFLTVFSLVIGDPRVGTVTLAYVKFHSIDILGERWALFRL